MSQLYDRFAPMVNGLALRITGHAGDAAEVVQETFTQVWRQAQLFNPQRGSVTGWICTIARTRSLDLLRLRARRPPHETEVQTFDARGEQNNSERTPEGDFLASESIQAVRAAIACLSTPERLALELAYFEDLSHSEIATRTGLPLGTVKTHISRAIRKLRDRIDAAHVQEASNT